MRVRCASRTVELPVVSVRSSALSASTRRSMSCWPTVCVILFRHGVEAGGNQVQHVGKQAAGAFGRVELQGTETVRLANAATQRLGFNLHHPEVSRFVVAEFIGLMAAFENEAAGIAAHVLAALGKIHLGPAGTVTRKCSSRSALK